MEAGLAGEQEAEALGIAPGDPVLLTRRLTYTERWRPIEYAIRSIGETSTRFTPGWYEMAALYQSRSTAAEKKGGR